MKTVAQLIAELQIYPQEAYVAPYCQEKSGIVIYPESFYKPRKPTELNPWSIGFVEFYYDDEA